MTTENKTINSKHHSPFQPDYHHRRYCFKNSILVFLVYLVDLAGLVFPIRRHSRTPSVIRRIGILVTDHLGDAILITPLLQNIHRLYPQARLFIVTTSYTRSIFQHHPLCHHLIQIDTPWLSKARVHHWAGHSWLNLMRALHGASLDAVIDTRSDARQILAMYGAQIPIRIGFTFSGLGFLLNRPVKFRYNPEFIAHYQVDNKLKLLQPLLDMQPRPPHFSLSRKPEYYFSPTYQPGPEIQSLSRTPYWILQVGGGGNQSAANVFPPHLIAPVLDYVQHREKRRLVIVGKKSETPDLTLPLSTHILDLRDQTSLDDLAYLVSHAELIICSSSLILHLAACFDSKSLAIFSLRDSPILWNPPGRHHRMLYHRVPCALCECDSCSDQICIQQIQPEDLVNQITLLLNPERISL